MDKKRKRKRKCYRLYIRVGIWNKACTKVARYECQVLLVYAKSAEMAVKKAGTKCPILRVVEEII